MPWGASKEKKEEKEPEVTEEEVLAFMINESTNDTLESTRYLTPFYQRPQPMFWINENIKWI